MIENIKDSNLSMAKKLMFDTLFITNLNYSLKYLDKNICKIKGLDYSFLFACLQFVDFFSKEKDCDGWICFDIDNFILDFPMWSHYKVNKLLNSLSRDGLINIKINDNKIVGIMIVE